MPWPSTLTSFRQDLELAWQRVIHCRFLSWLWPEELIALHQSPRSVVHCRGMTPEVGDTPIRTRPQFNAVLVPPELILERKVHIPALPPSETLAALQLVAESSSPFPSNDLAWTAHALPTSSGDASHHLALVTSPKITTDWNQEAQKYGLPAAANPSGARYLALGRPRVSA